MKLTGNLPFHYGWVIVLAGTLGVVGSIGLGRFALGMLFPSMASSLNLTYGQMGFISTANFMGYLLAVVFCGLWVIRIGARKLIFLALLLIGATMMMSAAAQGFVPLAILYTLTGMGSGASNVPIMALVSSWFTSAKRGRATGFVVIGSGFAIMAAGTVIPAVNAARGSEGWRASSLILGFTIIVISLLCLLMLRNKPEEMGLRPVGSGDAAPAVPDKAEGLTSIYRSRIVYHLGAIYFLFGYTYVIFVTFFVTSLVRDRGYTEAAAGELWSMVGFLSLFSGPVFGTLSDRIGRKGGLMLVFFFQTLSYFLIALALPGAALTLSIVFFGIVAWSIPSIMAAAVGDYMGPQRATAAFGFITFIFGIGQIIGPAVAGVLAERSGSFSGSFFMAAAAGVLAIVLSAFLKRPEQKGP